MDRNQVITALETLANGADPGSDAARALLAASAMLKSDEARAKKSETFRAAGARWEPEEDDRLAREFDSGMSVAQIALQHGRTSSAITLRLVKLGRIDGDAVKMRERGTRAAS